MVLSDGLDNISSLKKRYIPNLAVPSYDTFVFEISDEDKREEVKNILISSGIGTKNLPDAIRWHCSYYWDYFLEDTNNKYATETLQKLSKNIAIPIILKKDILEYKNILKEILNVFV